jgi:serine/threonine-protein kinase
MMNSDEPDEEEGRNDLDSLEKETGIPPPEAKLGNHSIIEGQMTSSTRDRAVLYILYFIAMSIGAIFFTANDPEIDPPVSDEFRRSFSSLVWLANFCLSLEFVLYAKRRIRDKCNMASNPLSWDISLCTSFIFIFLVSNGLIMALLNREGIAGGITLVLVNLPFAFPSIWLYLGFDNRDLKFAKHIVDPDHLFDDHWYLSSSPQNELSIFDTRGRGGRALVANLFLLYSCVLLAFLWAPYSTLDTYWDAVIIASVIFLTLFGFPPFLIFFFQYVMEASATRFGAGMSSQQNALYNADLDLELPPRSDAVYHQHLGSAYGSQVSRKVDPPTGAVHDFEVSPMVEKFLQWTSPRWTKLSRFGILNRNCWIVLVKNEEGRHIIGVFDTKYEAQNSQKEYHWHLIEMANAEPRQYAGPFPSETGLPTDIVGTEAKKRAEELARNLEIARLEAERLEAERLEAERLEAERLEAERLEAERLEAERLEAAEKRDREEYEKMKQLMSKYESDRASPLASIRKISEIESKYRRSELIGEGGMSNVHRAISIGDGERVVWKEAAPSRFNPLADVNQRLLNESEILRSLSHPRIPEHLYSGEIVNDSGNDVVVMIMEFIEGRSLKDEIDTLEKFERTMGFREVIEIISRICEPLEYMADLEVSVYHRDIKPANVIISPDRGPILIDFGLSKGVATGTDMSLSRGLSEGWSPPERRDGISGGFTDVFSLGQMLWSMLTGERPFHALSKEEISEKIVERGHPEWISDLIHASSQRHDRRIQSVYEFRMELEKEDSN